MTASIPSSLDEIDLDLSRAGGSKVNPMALSLKDIKALQDKPMMESALIQWAITRWRQAKAGELVIAGGGLEHFAATAPGAALALLPHGKINDITRKQSADFREKYLIEQRAWPDLAVTDCSAIYCLDAYPRWFPSRLYIPGEPPELMEPNGFKTLFEAMVESVSSEHRLKTTKMLMSENVGSILYELFKNTHDHARFGLQNERLGDSLRGIYMRFYPVQSLAWLENQTNEQQMSRNILETELSASTRAYFRGDVRGNKSNLSGFLELSVFDSGPGLAAKWMNSHSECESPYEAVLACFKKGATTTSDPTKGYGLYKVLTLLNQLKGVIRVRTNEIHLFRGFSLVGGVGVRSKDGEPDVPEFKLFDWKKGLTDRVGAYSKVDGALVSVMLPMEEA